MKILINTATTFKGGGIQVALSFIQECMNFSENEYHVILSPNLAKQIIAEKYANNFHFYKIPYRPSTKVLTLTSASKYLKRIEKNVTPDIVFTTSGPSYWRPEAPHLLGYNLPHYIYKESPFFNSLSLYEKLKLKFKEVLIFYFLKRDSDHYVVQTKDVCNRLKIKLSKENVYTISNSCSSFFLKQHRSNNLHLPDKLTREFRLLTLSAYYSHKGFEIFPQVIQELVNRGYHNIKFVVTLPEDKFISLYSNKTRNQMYNVGPIKNQECPSLYDECDALFLPTLLECFSASYVEAMKMKKPIITSNLGFAHTVCKDSALYFEPLDYINIANLIIKLFEEPKTIEHLVENGLKQLVLFNNANERANKYLNLCKTILSEK